MPKTRTGPKHPHRTTATLALIGLALAGIGVGHLVVSGRQDDPDDSLHQVQRLEIADAQPDTTPATTTDRKPESASAASAGAAPSAISAPAAPSKAPTAASAPSRQAQQSYSAPTRRYVEEASPRRAAAVRPGVQVNRTSVVVTRPSSPRSGPSASQPATRTVVSRSTTDSGATTFGGAAPAPAPAAAPSGFGPTAPPSARETTLD